jgi:hypothetical protein
MNVNFKFEIGQFVYSRQDVRSWRDRYGAVLEAAKELSYRSMGELACREHQPMALQVVERHLQQCYGGIQLHYHFRTTNGLLAFTEAELTDTLESAGIAPSAAPSQDPDN